MVHFQVNGKDKILTTNFKVMYRTLCSHGHLKEILTLDVLIIRFKCLFLFRKCRHVFLVRNPYSRVISFFQDKFRYNLTRGRKGRRYPGWQRSQKIFFPYLDVNKCDSYEVIVEKLASFNFNDLLDLLPKVYHEDFHMIPQCQVKIKERRLSLPVFLFSEIIKFEDQEAVKKMAVEFNLDLSIKKNTTSEQKIEDWFNPEMYAIINKIYKQDFKSFEYEMV